MAAKRFVPVKRAQREAELITSEDQRNLKEIFDFFDNDKDGVVPVSDLGRVVRAFGENPTEAEMHLIMQELNERNVVAVDFADVLDLIKEKFRQPGKPRQSRAELCESVISALKLIEKPSTANGVGKVSATEFAKIITSIGEKLTEDEVKQLLMDANIDRKGEFDLEVFARKLTAPTVHA